MLPQLPPATPNKRGSSSHLRAEAKRGGAEAKSQKTPKQSESQNNLRKADKAETPGSTQTNSVGETRHGETGAARWGGPGHHDRK